MSIVFICPLSAQQAMYLYTGHPRGKNFAKKFAEITTGKWSMVEMRWLPKVRRPREPKDADGGNHIQQQEKPTPLSYKHRLRSSVRDHQQYTKSPTAMSRFDLSRSRLEKQADIRQAEMRRRDPDRSVSAASQVPPPSLEAHPRVCRGD